MCKLYLRVERTPFNPMPIIKAVRGSLTSLQRDGLGIATRTGWAKSDNTDFPLEEMPKEIPKEWRGNHKKSILRGGTIDGPTKWLLMHGRTSTNARGQDHAHPFVGEKYTLAHNGVVDEIAEKKSSHACDSARLHAWLEAGGEMRKAHGVWSGYGVVMLKHAEFMDIWKDGACLHWIYQDGVWQFATALTDAIRKQGDYSDTLPQKCMARINLKTFHVQVYGWKGFGSGGHLHRQFGHVTGASGHVTGHHEDYDYSVSDENKGKYVGSGFGYGEAKVECSDGVWRSRKEAGILGYSYGPEGVYVRADTVQMNVKGTERVRCTDGTWRHLSYVTGNGYVRGATGMWHRPVREDKRNGPDVARTNQQQDRDAAKPRVVTTVDKTVVHTVKDWFPGIHEVKEYSNGTKWYEDAAGVRHILPSALAKKTFDLDKEREEQSKARTKELQKELDEANKALLIGWPDAAG